MYQNARPQDIVDLESESVFVLVHTYADSGGHKYKYIEQGN